MKYLLPTAAAGLLLLAAQPAMAELCGGLTDTLQAETDQLEDEKSALQTEIANLLKEKEKLEFILAAHGGCRS